MAFRKEVILPRQSIWDIAIQYYGDVTGVSNLIMDNPLIFDFEKTPLPGTIFFVQDNPINKKIVEFFEKQISKPAGSNDVPFDSSLWILDDGTWDDSRFWDDNKLWKDL